MTDLIRVGSQISEEDRARMVAERTKRNAGNEIKLLIISAGDKIHQEAVRQYKVSPGEVRWDSWSTGSLKLEVPIKIGDLKRDCPQLAGALTEPIGPVQRRRDSIDDETIVSEIGYWNNPDLNYIALIFGLRGSSRQPFAERKISLHGGHGLGKSWDMPGWKQETNSYDFQSPETCQALLAASQEAGNLIDLVIASGGFTADFASQSRVESSR